MFELLIVLVRRETRQVIQYVDGICTPLVKNRGNEALQISDRVRSHAVGGRNVRNICAVQTLQRLFVVSAVSLPIVGAVWETKKDDLYVGKTQKRRSRDVVSADWDRGAILNYITQVRIDQSTWCDASPRAGSSMSETGLVPSATTGDKPDMNL